MVESSLTALGGTENAKILFGSVVLFAVCVCLGASCPGKDDQPKQPVSNVQFERSQLRIGSMGEAKSRHSEISTAETRAILSPMSLGERHSESQVAPVQLVLLSGLAADASIFAPQKLAFPNLVIPTIFRNEPFGEYVEGLSYCGAKSYVVERKVQTHDLKDTTFFIAISAKPFLPKGLRKFKHFRCQVGRFVVCAVHRVELQLDVGQSIPNLGTFATESILINVL